MDTSAISYRVADFLKQHPPFSAMDELDLLELATRGRVRFHEANDYILWQGEPNKFKVFVIQQGTVSLWDEQGERPELRDVRGAGDLLGVEPFAGANTYEHSARASTDVLIYAFSAFDFEGLVLKYPYASQFIAAYGAVIADYHVVDERREPQKMFLHDLAAHRALPTCGADTSVREAARRMRSAGADAMVVLDTEQRASGILTNDALIAWIADSSGDADQPVATLLKGTPPAISPAASVVDGILTMAGAGESALAITSDGTPGGQLHAIVTPRDFSPVFGDQPVAMLQDIRHAASTRALRALNQRVRAFALEYLTTGGAVDWIARFTHLADVATVRRLIAQSGEDLPGTCWCLCGASGREESITRQAPFLVLIHDHHQDARARSAYQHVLSAFAECDYLPRLGLPFESEFCAAGVSEWTARYDGWIRDPIVNALFPARAMLDLRPIEGRRELWQAIVGTVAGATNSGLLKVMANDCLDSLPPLTFFHDAVVEESGAEGNVFQLQRSALSPLVDVGRVFGLAAGNVLGTSTLERFAMARRLLPDGEAIFREAAETLRVVLWQQGRIGISQGTEGAELPPTLLSRHDRHVLKGGFRSILRLIEYTADWKWLDAL